MKLSQLINYPLGLFGLRIIRKAAHDTVNRLDMEADRDFMAIYEKVKPCTMVEAERCYALYQSVNYIIKNSIPGDLVECGVWKGGSSMLMAYTLLKAGVSNRKIWLYDTFAGMTRPGEHDGPNEKAEWESNRVSDDLNKMCYSSLEEVKTNMLQTGFPAENIVWVKGKVEETIPASSPQQIALLRLDTDWYESTHHELHHLYPLVSAKGVLLVDDYGAWQGARKATDEYFGSNVFLHRIDWTGRLLIKD